MIDVRQRIACKAVLVKDGKILLLREASTYKDGTNVGRYHLPGGRVEPGEPFLDGLHREVREETGFEIEVGELIFASEWFPVIRGVQNQIVGMFFVCQPIGDTITLSEEHDAYKWVGSDDWRTVDTMGPEDTVLEKFFKQNS